MKSINSLIVIVLTGMLSCGNSNSYKAESPESYSMINIPEEDEKSGADRAMDESYEVVKKKEEASSTLRFVPPTVMPDFVASSAASTAFDDGVHKFIRTAQTRFKAKDVVSATRIVEDIALRNKGFIIKSAVSNENFHTETVNVSKDSAIVNYYCNLVSTIELKVPASSLDTILRQIAPLALLVDYRTVEAEDVTVRLMADQLAQIRLEKKGKRISNAIGTTGRKLNDVMDAEEALDATLEEADRKVISEYTMNERIAYSTLNISLYQDRIEYSEKVERKAAVQAYTPGFGAKFIDALAGGWSAVSILFLFLVNIWPFLLLLGIGAYVFVKIRERKNRTNG